MLSWKIWEENSEHAFWHRFAAHSNTHVLVRALRRCWAWPGKVYQTWGTSSTMQRSQNHPESIMLGKTTEILNPTYNQAPQSHLFCQGFPCMSLINLLSLHHKVSITFTLVSWFHAAQSFICNLWRREQTQ